MTDNLARKRIDGLAIEVQNLKKIVKQQRKNLKCLGDVQDFLIRKIIRLEEIARLAGSKI